MFFQKTPEQENISTEQALRHLLVFQLKLAADALRDLALSPVSIVVFLLDVVRKPAVEDSLYLRLMALGRHSDRLINLFGEYTEDDHFTLDEAIAQLEDAVQKARK